jgi:hypothetical protein
MNLQFNYLFALLKSQLIASLTILLFLRLVNGYVYALNVLLSPQLLSLFLVLNLSLYRLIRPINSIVIGWMSFTRIASLDASPLFITLAWMAEIELCLLLNRYNRFCY